VFACVCLYVCACSWPLELYPLREKAKKDKDEYYKKRQTDRKAHLKRTAKGQPVTKNLISSILDKLQKE